MRAREETIKVLTHKEWECVLEGIKGLVDCIEDGVFKENRKKQLQLISREMNGIPEKSIHGDSYTLHMHSLQILHDTLKGAPYDGNQFQFLQDFIHSFLKNNPRELQKVTDKDIKNGRYDIAFGVTSIGDFAFADCTTLTAVAMPVLLTSIGNAAFDGCINLTVATIPLGVASIGYFAFRDCLGLAALTIPHGVTSIGNCAFYRCTGLASIHISSSVMSIGSFAFAGCSNLTTVTIDASSEDEYRRILNILPVKLQNIVTNSLIEKTILRRMASRSPGFFGDKHPDLPVKIIATLEQSHGQLQLGENSVAQVGKP